MAENRPIELLSVTADTVGTVVNTNGGFFQVILEDTAGTGAVDYGGGTITLQTSFEGGGWQNVADSSGVLVEFNATNDFAAQIQLMSATQIRATLAGATAPDVKVTMV